MHARFFRSLYRIRRVEEEIIRVYPTDAVKSPVHLSIGQEAVSVGVCEALAPDDIVFGTYRGHAIYLAKGGDLRRMVAELYGKATGCSEGKGGSMHLIDVEHGVMGTSAIVASSIPQAVGYALGLRLQGKPHLVASFFGDGATDEGVFHESMNFAALKRLPVIFICENNCYAIHSHYLRRQPRDNLCERVRGYGIRAARIEGNDVMRIHEQVAAAADDIRNRGDGPWFFECMTYRWHEHVGPGQDWHLGYRPKSEAEPWIADDQLERMGRHLEPAVRKQIEAEVEAEIQDAIAFAEQSPYPEPEELYSHVFKEP